MRSTVRLTSAAGLLVPLLLSGCSLLPTRRKLPVPKAPAITQTVSPEELVARLNQRWDALQSLTATVEIQATELKTKEGVAETFPTCRGNILIRKPQMLRVLGRLFGVPLFDMTSNGENFKLVIPAKNIAFEGSDTAQEKSPNPMYNLRPEFFFDAMVVQGVAPDDHYFVTTDTETMEDVAKKHLYTVPEYILNINRVNPEGPKETPVRVITFHRDDLLPYAQDIYDSGGNPETHVTYQDYQSFNSVQFPSTIRIRNMVAGVELVLTIENVHENLNLKDDQFELELPKGIKIQHLN